MYVGWVVTSVAELCEWKQAEIKLSAALHRVVNLCTELT